MNEKILVTGALGQIGSELTMALREKYGIDRVLATDIKEAKDIDDPFYEKLDVLDKSSIIELVKKHQIATVYHLAAMLSATAEIHPMKAWDLNMDSLLSFLELAREQKIKQIFWPSSIAIFGADTPKIQTPQHALAIPTTVYGISKRAGELWCNYYHQKYDVDVRSIRYPGLISWKTRPGGGTTDYAVDIFYQAIEEGKYTCFLSKNTKLPMMYMDDAIRATIELMEAKRQNLKVWTSYNIQALSFTPDEIYHEIKKHIPEFQVSYQPDFRQSIADTWPESIDDIEAQMEWGWKPRFDLEKMTEDMLLHLQKKLKENN